MTACLPSDLCIPTRLPRSAKSDRLAIRLPRGEKIPISASLYDVPTNALPNVKEKRTPIVPCLSMSKMPMPPVPVVIVGTGANGAIYSVKVQKKKKKRFNFIINQINEKKKHQDLALNLQIVYQRLERLFACFFTIVRCNCFSPGFIFFFGDGSSKTQEGSRVMASRPTQTVWKIIESGSNVLNQLLCVTSGM